MRSICLSDENGKTPILMAIKKKQYKVVKKLFEKALDTSKHKYFLIPFSENPEAIFVQDDLDWITSSNLVLPDVILVKMALDLKRTDLINPTFQTPYHKAETIILVFNHLIEHRLDHHIEMMIRTLDWTSSSRLFHQIMGMFKTKNTDPQKIVCRSSNKQNKTYSER